MFTPEQQAILDQTDRNISELASQSNYFNDLKSIKDVNPEYSNISESKSQKHLFALGIILGLIISIPIGYFLF